METCCSGGSVRRARPGQSPGGLSRPWSDPRHRSTESNNTRHTRTHSKVTVVGNRLWSMAERSSPCGNMADGIPVLASHFLDTQPPAGKTDTAVIVCNWELPDITPIILQNARVRVCADGGANRLFDQVPLLFPDRDPDHARQEYLPDLITGDLDSIRDDVRKYYEACGVKVVDLSHDQDSTDLMKCIEAIVRGHNVMSETGHFGAIVALGAQGGRLDHTLGHLSVLHKYREFPLVLLGERNMTRLVPKGTAVIKPSTIEGPKCGLVPLTGEATVTSRGLEWNLENTKMQMGGLVSTSNHIAGHGGTHEQQVFVETDTDLIWTVELQY